MIKKIIFTVASVVLVLGAFLMIDSVMHPGVKHQIVSKDIDFQIKAINCDGSDYSEKIACYSDYYGKFAEDNGIETALLDIKKRYDSDSFVNAECHQMVHSIGNAAVDRYKDVSEAFSKGDSFCWSGYYHGVVEEVVERAGSDKLTNQINDLCRGVNDKLSIIEKIFNWNNFDYSNCIHGLGHGAMTIVNNDVPDSIAICDKLNGLWEQQTCGTGVFMENIIIDSYHAALYLKPDDPLYPCDIMEDKYKLSCYLIQTSYMLKVTNNDFSKVFELCGMAGDEYTDICQKSLGRDVSAQALDNISKNKELCFLGKNIREQSNCFWGAAANSVLYYHSDDFARKLCSELTGELQKKCLSGAIEMTNTL